MKRVGFIGLGTMGAPMASNLIKAGHTLTVFNRNQDKTLLLKELGAKVAATPAEVAEQSEVVWTMLTADQAVMDVTLGNRGIKEGASAGLIVIDSSTVSPATSRTIAGELAKMQVQMLDAPVTGSRPQANNAQLTFLVGGKREIYEHCLSLFQAMGKASYYMGESGAGTYTKLANNLMSAINLIAFTEALVLAAKAGIDPRLFVEVVSIGGARSGQAENKAGKVISRDFDPNFTAFLMHKDLSLVNELTREFNLPLPAAAIVREMLNMAIAKGYGHEDVCSVIKCYEDWARIQVGS